MQVQQTLQFILPTKTYAAMLKYDSKPQQTQFTVAINLLKFLFWKFYQTPSSWQTYL